MENPAHYPYIYATGELPPATGQNTDTTPGMDAPTRKPGGQTSWPAHRA